jgi:hypothetical protein
MQLLSMILKRYCVTSDALDWHRHRDWHVYDVTIPLSPSYEAHRLIAPLIHWQIVS